MGGAPRGSGWSVSGPRAAVHPVDPGGEARVAVADRLALDEDPVEELVVPFRQAEATVLEEREGDHVGHPELAEQMVAPRQELLEQIEPGEHPVAERVRERPVGLLLAKLGLELVRRSL